MTNEPRDPVGALVRLAGPRDPVPPDRLHRLRASAHAEWRVHVSTHRRRAVAARAGQALAAAALVVLGIRLGVNREPAVPPAPAEVATVERALGAVRVVSATTATPRLLNAGDRLREGDRLDTSGGGRVVVLLTGGARVRVDQGTLVRWAGASVIALDAGAIYVEASHGTGAALEVQTPFGVARDIGTRFEARLRDDALVVRVRDGLVRVSRPDDSHDVNPGDELTVGTDGRTARRTIAPSGPEWTWAMTLARPFTLEGRSLGDFLDWAAAETGWRVQFVRATDEQRAAHTRLHGSIAGLTPDEAIEAVLPVSGVDHVLADGILTIRRVASD